MSKKLEAVAPMLGRAHTQLQQEQMRGITRCWQNFGYHVYGAGPCFDSIEAAVRYRASLDREGVTWRSQR